MRRKGKPTPRRVRRAISTIQDYLQDIDCAFAVISNYGTSFHKSSISATDIDEIRRWQQYAEEMGIVRPPGSSQKQD
jgi:hypothetical protein